MRHLVLGFSFVCVIAFQGLSSASAQGFDADPPEKLLGEWRVIAMKAEGRDVEGPSWRGMKFNFREEAFILTPGKSTPAGLKGRKPQTVPYSVDARSNPKALTFTTHEDGRDIQFKVIYKIEDEELLICLGKERPKTFNTAGGENLCYTFKRVDAEKIE